MLPSDSTLVDQSQVFQRFSAHGVVVSMHCGQAQDPLESTNQAAAQPEIVKRLQAELAKHTADRYTGGLDKAKTKDHDLYCAWIAKVGWVQPFDPLV
jgi:hypothetical protein